jgi:hypothetical protein
VVAVALTPVVSWPREAAPGGRYLVTVDVQLKNEEAAWPYPDEEYTVGLMLSGRSHLSVSTLGDTSVVLHRFGGTYGPARFVVAVNNAADYGVRTGLWLTLISAGGVPFHTAELPVTVTRDAPVRPPATDLPLAHPAAPGTELGQLAGDGSNAWSMAAIVVNGRPLLALGTDDGYLRLWEPTGSPPTALHIARGAVRLAPITVSDGRTLLIAAAGETMTLVDPARGTVVDRKQIKEFDTVTALAPLSRPDGSTWIAVGTSRGAIYLSDEWQGFRIHSRLDGHRGSVFTMTSFNIDGFVRLASAGADSTLRIWDVENNSLLTSMIGHTAQINNLTTARDDRGRTLIATASDDGSLRIWDPVTGMNAGAFTSRDEWINAVTEVSGRGQQPLLVWGGRDGTLWWSNQLTDSYSVEAEDRRAVTALTPFVSAGRSILAIARAGGHVQLRETTTFTVDELKPSPPEPGSIDVSAPADAVIVIPGIMGSELVDAESGKALWGLSDLGWYASAWTTGTPIKALQLTDEERQGRTGRVRATRLLRMPAFAPLLGGTESYTQLVSSIQRLCRHPDAVLQFAYDWRLSVTHNAHTLAQAAEQHLLRWRTHRYGSSDARLVLVAHGEGGLIARYYVGVLGGRANTRLTIGIGVPYLGTVAAVELVQGSRFRVSLPLRRMRELARTLPGVYDLLPFYRCVSDASEVRRLTPDDIASLGGDPRLAAEAIKANQLLNSVDSGLIRSVIGVGQPTAQSLTLQAGSLILHRFLPTLDADGTLQNVDHQGDGTVPRFSAQPPGEHALSPMYVAQTSGALPRDRNVRTYVTSLLTERLIGPPR